MTVRLELVCHASTSATRTAAFPADEPLDDRALRRLAVLASDDRRADRVLTSPALRARQTAEAMKLTATLDPELRDCDYGRWAGLGFDEVQAREPEAAAEWLRDPTATPHGGESREALMRRVAVWLGEQLATKGKVLAVTHASVIRAAIVHAIEAGPRSFWRIDVAPLSVARLSGHDGRWILISLGALDERRAAP
jgi:broad specificity phosphatase PhoE